MPGPQPRPSAGMTRIRFKGSAVAGAGFHGAAAASQFLPEHPSVPGMSLQLGAQVKLTAD